MSTQTKSKKLGKNISAHAEIQNISTHGMWVLVHDQEFFIPFKEFPWFLQATIEQLHNLEFSHNKYLHWPSLDVDIELESLKNLDAYPLKYS